MSHGIFQLNPNTSNLSQLAAVVMPAMTNRVGGVMTVANSGVSIDPTGLINLLPATATQLGGITVGAGLSVDVNGVLSTTPWTSDINAASFGLGQAGWIEVGSQGAVPTASSHGAFLANAYYDSPSNTFKLRQTGMALSILALSGTMDQCLVQVSQQGNAGDTASFQNAISITPNQFVEVESKFKIPNDEVLCGDSVRIMTNLTFNVAYDTSYNEVQWGGQQPFGLVYRYVNSIWYPSICTAATQATGAVVNWIETMRFLSDGTVNFISGKPVILGGYLQFPDATRQSTAFPGIAATQTPWLQNISAAGFTLSGVPTVTGNGNITLAAGGAGNLNLNTNGLTRLSIDSTGTVWFEVADGYTGGNVWFAGGSTSSSYLQATGYLNINSRQSAIQLNASTNINLQTGSSLATRFAIDSAGHVTINAPDDSINHLNLVAGGYTSNIFASGASLVIRCAALAGAFTYVEGDVLAFYTNISGTLTERMRISQTGNVGIATTTPLNLFQVHAATNQNIGLRSYSGRASIAAFNDAGSAAVTLGFDASVFDFEGGSVGIATNAPLCLFDVNGVGLIRNNLELGSALNFNCYWGGSGWVYRANGAALVIGPTTINYAVSGTAGGAAAVQAMFTFGIQSSVGATFANCAFVQILAQGAGSVAESFLQNFSTMCYQISNTQLGFALKGSDGVIRRGSITLA